MIEALNGQLVTHEKILRPTENERLFVSDASRDILKTAVVNRYVPDAPPALAFITNFGLKKGAIASCIAHDSHNIICVGCSDEEICAAINAVIEEKGGISVAWKTENKKEENSKEEKKNGEDALIKIETKVLPLPVAGIMSIEDGYKVAEQYTEIDLLAKKLGTTLDSPFMTLSFMALLVIPSLKLSDKGLFDVNRFAFV